MCTDSTKKPQPSKPEEQTHNVSLSATQDAASVFGKLEI